MSELEVRILELEPMRVASVRAISDTPERDALQKLRAWAVPKGLLDDLERHPVFGFNNPDPTPGELEYGYEFWIRVGPDVQPEGEVQMKEFSGGTYAITTCKLSEEISSEFFAQEGYLPSWKKLVDWAQENDHQFGRHQALEKTHDPTAPEQELVLDLYLPIKS